MKSANIEKSMIPKTYLCRACGTEWPEAECYDDPTRTASTMLCGNLMCGGTCDPAPDESHTPGPSERFCAREALELVTLGERCHGRDATAILTHVIHHLVQAHQDGRDITFYKDAVDALNAGADELLSRTN